MLKMALLLLSVLLFFSCYLASSWAQDLRSQTNVSTFLQRFSGQLTTGYSSNLYERDSHKAEAQGTLRAVLGYDLQASHQVKLLVSGQQEQYHGRESTLNDGLVWWGHPGIWFKNDLLTVGQQVRVILPLSKESRLRDQKTTGVIVAPSVEFKLTPLGLTGVTLGYSPSLIRNFHRYKQNRVNRNNTQYSLSNFLSLNWQMTDRFLLSSFFSHTKSWSYEMVTHGDVYMLGIEGGASLNKAFALALGFTNSGSIKNLEYGSDQTVEVFDKQTARVYTELSYSF